LNIMFNCDVSLYEKRDLKLEHEMIHLILSYS
jgi:hypothetical protein